MQQDHLRKMYELQREIERLRHDTVYLRMREQKPSKIIVHQPPAVQAPPPQVVASPAPVQTKFIEVDRLAPYDYSPRQPYAHTWAKTHYRQDVNSDPYYELRL
ncbi:hypothetical protein PoB_000666600 [Plakobranchus ocellatus]|uniref:Uncharacterized protein n=1 Tax=Plakobranchus ocellatus TaxID=259542 RepID=A0AAV3YAA6_9GAST|nr:hypothetical protein PoB_000666600 [Plakobranchus ocellatus]